MNLFTNKKLNLCSLPSRNDFIPIYNIIQYNIHMIKIIIQIIIIIVYTHTQKCDSTMMELYTEYSLGRQDELNRTIKKLQQSISTLPDVSLNINTTYKMNIRNIQLFYSFYEGQQKTEIVGDDTIIMRGAQTDIKIKFEWMK